MMKCNLPFILENNFENISRKPLMGILDKYDYTAITVTLTGEYSKIYERFVQRNCSPDRHRGHVVNDSYPEQSPNRTIAPISYESFVHGITHRGMDHFAANGPQIVVDTTDFHAMQMETVLSRIDAYREQILREQSDCI